MTIPKNENNLSEVKSEETPSVSSGEQALGTQCCDAGFKKLSLGKIPSLKGASLTCAVLILSFDFFCLYKI